MRKRAEKVVISLIVCAGIMFGIRVLPLRLLYAHHMLILVESARTQQQREQGLQGRAVLNKNSGMLFFFEEEGYPRFWMKNTFIPLDIAFLDARKKIVDIQEMVPLQIEQRYGPPVKVKYALEMNAGWFKKQGIKNGERVFFW
jgi:uncharacterized membrane protein (UPF0127 family)